MTATDSLPYKAINVFIEEDYLQKVLETILSRIDEMEKEDRFSFISDFKQHVSVLGFRNPIRAPLSIQVKAYLSAFEAKDEVIPFTLSAWAKLNAVLAQLVENFLDSEGWKELRIERKYNEGEGFSNDWPEKLSFDKLVKNFKKANPDADFSRDDLILMALWISGKLPDEQSVI